MDYRGRTTLITGASSGIGAGFARALAAKGSDLVLVARTRGTLEKLADELRAAHDIQAYVIACDLAVPDASDAVKRETDRLGLDIDVLVNSAGFGSAGRFGDIAADRVVKEVALDVGAVVGLTRTYLPGMAQRSHGVVINVSSTAGSLPTPYMSIYGASKAFVTAFSESLWAEYRTSGIRVLALCPGPVRTNFFDVVGTENIMVGQIRTTEQVVESALRAVDRGKPRVVPGILNGLLTQATRLGTRRLALGIAERMLRKAGRTPSGPEASATPS